MVPKNADKWLANYESNLNAAVKSARLSAWNVDGPVEGLGNVELGIASGPKGAMALRKGLTPQTKLCDRTGENPVGENRVSKLDEAMNAAIEELGRLARAEAAVGQPIVAGAYTIVPICQVGFGGGMARGGVLRIGMGDEDQDKAGDRSGGGLGFGGGVRPIAVVIIGPEGARIEPVPQPGQTEAWAKAVNEVGRRFGATMSADPADPNRPASAPNDPSHKDLPKETGQG